MQNRQELRQFYSQKRRLLSVAEKNHAANELAHQIARWDRFQNSQHLAFYFARQGELDPHPLVELAWQLQKQCYFPVLDPDNGSLHFLAYSLGDPLTLNRYKIPEPALPSAKSIAPQQLDLVFVPLLAFDGAGHRLGSGAGYYDKTFAFLLKTKRPATPFLVGLAYEWQNTTHLQSEAWDVPLDAVATDQHFYRIQHTL